MSSYYFDDYKLGERFITPARTITETDVVIYAGLSGDYNQLHVDAEFAARTPFGQRIAHGTLVAGIVNGLWCRLGLNDGSAIGLLETKTKFQRPVFFGDTVHGEISVTELKQTSKPGRGIVRYKIDTVNQKGEICQEGEFVAMVLCRPS
jgi:acyl dehydratase